MDSHKAIMPPTRLIAREGIPFVLIAVCLSALAIYFAGFKFGVISLGLPLFVLNFFRNPERSPLGGEDLLVSPADGTVLSVTELEEKRYFNNRRMKRICIFMSVINVHVNRIPLSGRIKSVTYNPGKFLIGFAEKASLDNEQNAIVIEGERGREVLFVQIAGFIARRIVCYLKGGEEVQRGERFGLIRFGSRVDVYLPLDSEILVKKGDKVRAGESPLARLL